MTYCVTNAHWQFVELALVHMVVGTLVVEVVKGVSESPKMAP